LEWRRLRDLADLTCCMAKTGAWRLGWGSRAGFLHVMEKSILDI
jgi:hypothetical protein